MHGKSPVDQGGAALSEVVVIDYEAGNLYNVAHALKRIGIGFEFSDDPAAVESARRVILPGVGSAEAAMESLKEKGLVETLRRLKSPFLGICLGMQLLFEASEEKSTSCLGILEGQVELFESQVLKVPHIGWNQVVRRGSGRGEALLQDIPDSEFFYFVHSYFAPEGGPETVAVTDYGREFASVVSRDNFYGVQFHPERSGEVGLKLLSNFMEIEAA